MIVRKAPDTSDIMFEREHCAKSKNGALLAVGSLSFRSKEDLIHAANIDPRSFTLKLII